MCQDFGDSSSVLSWAAGFSVADVVHSRCGPGVLDEDFAVEVGHGDVVTVDVDQDLLAGQSMNVPAVFSVATRVPAGRSCDGDTGRCRVGVGGANRGRSGLGRGASALVLASHAVRGVTRPGSP